MKLLRFSFLGFLLVLASCSNTNDFTEKIAAEDGKLWYRFTEAERGTSSPAAMDMETWTFYNDGRMNMNLSAGDMPGTWEYQEDEQLLMLVVDGNAIGFTVNDIRKKRLVLEASDGGIVELRTEKELSSKE